MKDSSLRFTIDMAQSRALPFLRIAYSGLMGSVGRAGHLKDDICDIWSVTPDKNGSKLRPRNLDKLVMDLLRLTKTIWRRQNPVVGIQAEPLRICRR